MVTKQGLFLLATALSVGASASLLPPSLHAQTTGATLSGTVADPNGSLIPQATVKVHNLAQGTERTTTSNSKGEYIFPNLQPGPYDIEVSFPGFNAEKKSGVVLTVGERPVVDFALKVSSVEQTTEVTDTTSKLELGSASISAVVTGETTRELPLNGRDWTQLATLQPGIAAIRSQPDATSTTSRGNRGFGQQLTISGGRPQQNSYRLDGIVINDYANSAPGSTAGLSLGAEAIQEFSVISSNYSASYGLTSGGVINAITRSGTNKFHGSVYEFLRNDFFDSEFFTDAGNPTGRKLPFRRNQYGATIGGPIFPNKTFFFANYEGFRQVLSSATTSIVPTALARTGVLTCTQAAAGATQSKTCLTGVGGAVAAPGVAGLTQVTVDPTSARYLGFFPGTNAPLAANSDTGSFIFASKEFTPENFVTARIDHLLSAKDSLSAIYLYDNGNTAQPDNLNVLTNLSNTVRQVFSLSESHVFTNSLYNALRIGLDRETAGTLITQPGANPLGVDPSLGAVSGLFAPGLQVSGIASFAGGLNSGSLATYGFTTPQFYDDAFYTRGNHSLRFGFAFQRILLNTTQQTTPDGVFKYGSLSAFLQNSAPTSIQVQLTPGTPRNLRQNIFAGYVEDDWKVRKDLVIVAGVRYEPSSVPTELRGKTSNIQSLTSPTTVTGDPYFQNPTLKNFEPRVGFSYSPGAGKGGTVLRGGYGIFDVLPLTYQFNLMITQAAPFTLNASSTTNKAGDLASQGYMRVAASTAGSLRTTYVQFTPPRNYVQQWNLSMEQQMGAGITLNVAYVGSHGVHQALRTTDANVVQPTIDSAGDIIFPCAVEGVAGKTCKTRQAVINPAFGQIDGQNWNASSVYSGLLASVKGTLPKGLQWQGSFTWQKSLDTNSSVIAGGPFQNSISGQFLFDPLKGPSDFSVPKLFVGNLVYAVPTVKIGNRIAASLVNGWQVGGIFQATDGLPFTPVISGDPLGEGNTVPFDVPDRVVAPGCYGNPVNSSRVSFQHFIKTQCFAFPTNNTSIAGNRFGNAGRNSIYGPGVIEMDMSLVRNFALPRLSEASRLQFRAEAFNIANHPNLAAPYANNKLFDVTTAPISSAGQITSTSTTPREIQLALKLSF